jgi:hypothetical protein
MSDILDRITVLEGKGYSRSEAIEIIKLLELSNISQAIKKANDTLRFMTLKDTD